MEGKGKTSETHQEKGGGGFRIATVLSAEEKSLGGKSKQLKWNMPLKSEKKIVILRENSLDIST